MKRNTRYKTGFTVAELLMALAIAGMLLAAVAVAFNASAINYRQNEDIFKATNGARQAMFRMISQLRTADAVDADPNSPANECALITPGGDDITYRYEDNKLYLHNNDTGIDYVLCDNVTALTFTKDTVVEDMQTKVRSVQISITVASGDVQQTVSAAAVVRRNLN